MREHVLLVFRLLVITTRTSALLKKGAITIGALEVLAPGNFFGLPAAGKRTVFYTLKQSFIL